MLSEYNEEAAEVHCMNEAFYEQEMDEADDRTPTEKFLNQLEDKDFPNDDMLELRAILRRVDLIEGTDDPNAAYFAARKEQLMLEATLFSSGQIGDFFAERDNRLTTQANREMKEAEAARADGNDDLDEWLATHAQQLICDVENAYSEFKEFA